MGTINIKDIQQKLYEKLKPSGWGDRLKVFLLSEEFTKILNQLLKESTAGDKFTPVLKQIFRMLEECPYNDLKVVILNENPYPKANVADGLAFSASNTDKVPSTLNYMFNEIGSTIINNIPYAHDKDLTRWASQGVLMLNTNITTTLGKLDTHAELWKPFTTFLFDVMAHSTSGIIYVFMGKDVRKWSENIPPNNYKFFVVHPASAAYKEAKHWESGDMFNNINKILMENHNTKIEW